MSRTILAACFLALAATVRADEAPLYQQEPYDTITLDDANKNAELKVRPLDLPDGRVPAKPNPTDELEIRLLDRPRKVYKVAWGSIVAVKLFEDRVLAEAERLVAAKKLDAAYPYYGFLERRYPKMPALAASYAKYLMAGARESFIKGNYEECLALSWELYRRDPNFKGAATAIVRADDKLIARRFAEGDFAAARTLLQEAADRLKDRAAPLSATWTEKLQAKAATQLAAAKDQAAAKHYSEASRLAREALAAWPGVAGGRQLAAAIRREHPEVIVGVTARAAPDAAPWSSWAARRDSRLLARSIVEVVRIGSAGDESGGSGYAYPLAKAVRSKDDRRVTLTVDPRVHWSAGDRPVTGADLARALEAQADRTDPLYRPAWNELVSGVSVGDGGQVRIDFKQPLPTCEPWLEVPVWLDSGSPGRDAAAPSLGPYRIAATGAVETRYAAVEGYFAAAQPLAPIIERQYPDVAAALLALKRGEITAVDRVGPWDAAALADSQHIAVEPCGPPTEHLLVADLRRPLLDDPIFRRALAHAVDRSGILIDQLSRGKLPDGCRIANELLPASSTGSASAINQAAALRHDSGVAKLLAEYSVAKLMIAAQASGAKESGVGGRGSGVGEASGAMAAIRSEPLVLAYPPTAVARLACQAIRRQLNRAGIFVRLKAMAANGLSDSADADLIYVEWTPFEPMVELPRLVGRAGLGGDAGPLVEQLLHATVVAGPAEAGQRASALDDAIAAETLVIPLWRLQSYVAYRRELSGLGRHPITLYQNVERWKLSAAEPKRWNALTACRATGS